jgi:hypothetical protein
MTTTQIYFNPWDPDFCANPYPHYVPLLAGSPRVLDLMEKVALAARYADVVTVLKDSARFSADRAR